MKNTHDREQHLLGNSWGGNTATSWRKLPDENRWGENTDTGYRKLPETKGGEETK